MLSKPLPAWILFGGFTLSAMAGTINAVGFLGLHHQALAHMSGPLTILSNELARTEMGSLLNAVLVILAFFAGCSASAAVIGQATLKLGRRYGLVLVFECALLMVAWGLLMHGLLGGEYVAAFACGLQNAMVSNYSGAVIRTTHMTGIITDLGIALGHRVRGERVDHRRVGLYLVLLFGFLVGGVAGSYGFIKIGFHTLLFPALLSGLAGGSYMLLGNTKDRSSISEGGNS